MKDLIQFITEKFKISKDIPGVSHDILSIRNMFYKIDHKSIKVFDEWIDKYDPAKLTFYFPEYDQVIDFKKDCEKYNINFEDTELINLGNSSAFIRKEAEMIDDRLLNDRVLVGDTEKEHIKYEGPGFVIYIGQKPENGIMVETDAYWLIIAIED